MINKGTDREIGKILESNSQIDYICEIYGKNDVEYPPSHSDYKFGQFVSIEKRIENKQIEFVGVIYNSQIVDPEQGRSGPKLSRPEEQNMFYPSYVDEKKTIVGIALLGYIESSDERKRKRHCIPPWTLEVDDIVVKLNEEEMVFFHEIEDEIKLGYYQNLLGVAGQFGKDLLSIIITRLKEKRPKERRSLSLIEKNLEYKKMTEGM